MNWQPWLSGVIAPAVSLIGTLAAWYLIWSDRRKSRLDSKLRRALLNGIALYRSEQLLCDEIANGKVGQFAGKSALAVKRAIRSKLRAQGSASPGDEATPERMLEELERFG